MLRPERLTQILSVLASLLCLGSTPFSGWVGCGSTPESSPTPVPGDLETWEDQLWGGWLDYSDALVKLHLWTTFELYAHRDGMFCGRYRAWWFSEGSYLAVNDGDEWITIVQDTQDDGMSGYSQGRAYGLVAEDQDMDGWLDLTTSSEVAAVDPYSVPEFTTGKEYFFAGLRESSELFFDTQPLTIGELIELANREAAEPMSAETLSTLPTSEVVDLQPYTLEWQGPYINAEIEATFCQWCKEPNDDATPSPLLSSHPTRNLE